METPSQPEIPPLPQGDGVAVARRKFECPACGGEAQWNPAKHALVCPYCGTESPAELEQRDDTTVIVEHDLATALRSIPDSARGWNAEKVSVQCQSCKAISVFDPARQAQRCQFCGSAQLVPYDEAKPAFRPESVLPFKVSEPAVTEPSTFRLPSISASPSSCNSAVPPITPSISNCWALALSPITFP